MTTLKVDPAIAGARFRPYEFAWTWETCQLISRAAGCSIRDPLDRRYLLRDSARPGHPMVAFNGAILARNRPEVMDRLIGGYDKWQQVGRWGSANVTFGGPVPRAGRGRVGCGFTEVGATSKGHALVRFAFEVDDADSGTRLAEGSMLLFLLGCAPTGLGKLSSTPVTIPDRVHDVAVRHETPVNVTFDWAMPSEDWNTTHFEAEEGSPAPLVHGPRNMALLLHDAARTFAGGEIERVRSISLGSIPAPHYPGETTETYFWKEGDDRLLARLVVPPARRFDIGAADKVVIDQIEIGLR
jgi:hypothetical protein